MPGWIFVSILLVTATILAAVSGRPGWLVIALGAATVTSVVAGALVRPDRQVREPVDTPRR
jgi:hypothetical protein